MQKLATTANSQIRKQPARVGKGKLAPSGKAPHQKMMWK